MKYTILLSFILLLSASCKRDVQKDGELCTTRSNDDSGALRLGGFYYYDSPLSSGSVSVYILNANGTVGRTGMDLPLTNASEVFSSSDFLNFASDNKGYWGVYHIVGSNIFIETWHADSNGRDDAYRWSGEILSDTSFVIKSSERCNGSEYSTENELYYFYPCENKPDSVTSLIP